MAVITTIICDMCGQAITSPRDQHRKVNCDLTGDKFKMQSVRFDLHAACVDAAIDILRPLFKKREE